MLPGTRHQTIEGDTYMDKVAIGIMLLPFGFAAISLIIAILQLMNKGFPINTAYLFSSQIVRDTMDKKPYFRQSGIVFLMITAIFMFMGIDLTKGYGWSFLLEIAMMIATVVYIIKSNKKMGK